ncbi:MAG: nucleotidyltransferase family protein [Deltaproteobacteria bacterium]|nr:nucleotidyltransferase family protein [Deltaproteobacteria bacterium]
MSSASDDHGTTLRAIVRADTLLMRLLRAVRSQALPGSFLAAGVVRDRVWDHLHGLPARPPKDVDVIFFDEDAEESLATETTRALSVLEPDVVWDVVNQAHVHRWYRDDGGGPVPPLRSSEHGISTWPETVTCLGVRLCDDDTIEVCAPHGLDDLFALRWRHHAARASLATFERRLASKGVTSRWPRAVVIR